MQSYPKSVKRLLSLPILKGDPIELLLIVDN